MTRLLIVALCALNIHAGGFQIAQGIVSIVANAPAAYQAVAHPVRSVKAAGGAVKAVAKKIKKGKKT